MISTRRPTPLLFLALFALAGALAAKSISIQIHVQSSTGGNVEAAAIQLASASGDPFTGSGATDAGGLFSIELPDAKGQYRIQISRAGFHDFDETIDFKGQRAARGKELVVKVELQAFNAIDFFNAGVALLRTKELDRAEAEFRKAVALDPNLARGWGVLAIIQLEGGRHQGALDDATRALELEPSDMQALRTQHEALVALHRDDDAELALTDLYQKDRSPDTVRLLFNSGAQAANSGATDKAKARLGQALELDPQLWQAHNALAELAVREERLDDAVTELDAALEISPRNFKIWERKIEILRALGKDAEAEAETAKLAETRTQS